MEHIVKKDEYQEPRYEILRLDVGDIMTTSGRHDWELPGNWDEWD